MILLWLCLFFQNTHTHTAATIWIGADRSFVFSHISSVGLSSDIRMIWSDSIHSLESESFLLKTTSSLICLLQERAARLAYRIYRKNEKGSRNV